MATKTVLVLNSGSSSIKYQLVNPETGEAIASGLVERIGEAVGNISHNYNGTTTEVSDPVADHEAGMHEILRLCAEVGPDLSTAGIVAVGHRVVQGGEHFSGPAIIDERVHALITQLCPLAPLHNPPNLKGIDVARELMPDVPHVAVFDTAFFQGLPAEAATYALDKEVAAKYSIRRYGAHGTSHQFVSSLVSAHYQRDDLKQVVLHMGNGASASAVVGSDAVDTSMGLTPLEGLVMGTRTGDIDAATVFHLSRQAGMSIDEIDTLFNKKSGLKGMTGDNDMRAVRERAANGDAEARAGLDVYIHRLVKYVGSYTAVMNGLDVLAFTAGVGENDVATRSELCARLGYLGLELDEEKNRERGKGIREISTPTSKVKVVVAPTNEELAIARQAMSLL